LQIPLIGALNFIALLAAKMSKLTRANNYNSKDYKSSVGSAPDLGRFSDPEADPLLGQ
jgi:hypothetical protein